MFGAFQLANLLKRICVTGANAFKDCTGSAAVSFAILAPVLLTTSGVAMDYAVMTMKQTELQNTADAASIAATKELAIAGSTQETISGVAQSYVEQGLKDRVTNIQTDVMYDKEEGQVSVTLTETWSPVFAHYVGLAITPIVASASAISSGSSNVCILALDPAANAAIELVDNARISGPTCAIYSNSTATSGVKVASNSSIKAEVTCTAGGITYAPGKVTADPITDCPPLPDPLADRAPPTHSNNCSFTNHKVTAGITRLKPGVYCGGLEISSFASVTLDPGDYIIKDGPFKIAGLTFVKGKDIAFYLEGAASVINFQEGSTVALSGRVTGDMAGLLFFEDRSVSIGREHRIATLITQELTGTIYLPRGHLLINPAAIVADKSAYTAIIARRLALRAGPELVLNTNYSGTNVPVPTGIKGARNVRLVK